MSVINKKPYIETVLETLTKDNLTTLIGLVNGGEGNITFKSYINTSYAFSTSDKGVKRIILEVKDNVFTGYLIYNNSYCVVVAYDSSFAQKLKLIKLDYANDEYEFVDEDLTINEFRRLIEGRTTNLVVESGKPLYHHSISIGGYDPNWEGQETMYVIIDLVCEVSKFNNFAQLKDYLDGLYDHNWTENDGMVPVHGYLGGVEIEEGALLLVGNVNEDLDFLYAPKFPVTLKDSSNQNKNVYVNKYQSMWFSPDGSGVSEEPASFTDKVL